jgi:aryl-phospho-beta-D-glucosidase BglC (GH1 family)
MSHPTNRREFIAALGAAAAAGALPAGLSITEETKLKPAQTTIPRWRGFNILDFFQAMSSGTESAGVVPEDDCKWIRDWGFDFVRLPMDYWLWIDSDWRQTRKLRPDDMMKISQSALEKVDRAVDLCRKYSLHVSLNFHRAPGYCINDPEREPLVVWRDQLAEDAFVHHWDVFAKRYKGIPSKELSFNLVNEAPSPRQGYMTREDYRRVMTRATEKIRETSPDRLVIIDGLSVGNEVVAEMIPTKVAQSVHAYRPAEISHFRASWVDRTSTFPEPTWPLTNKDGSIKLDRSGLEELYAPWAELARKGIGVHCGEGGAFNRTPYKVFMAWMTDVMDILQGHGIGYALWNFRGSFGILDSGRKDVEYEDWHGHKLDRQLLSVLQRH